MIHSAKRTIILLIGILAAITGFLIILHISTRGIGLSPDSVDYISAANNLVHDGKLNTFDGNPFQYFPPLYPIILSIPGFSGLELSKTARYLQALLFGLNIFVISRILNKMTNGSIFILIVASLLFLTAYPLIHVHAYAWSEPIFILFSLTSIYLIAKHLLNPRTVTIAGAAVFIGLSILTRYIGLALIPTALISIWLFGRNLEPKEKIKSSVYVLLSLTSIGLWIIRNILLTGTAANRSLIFHPVSKETLRNGYHTISSWFIILNVNQWIRWEIVAFILFVIGVHFYRQSKEETKKDETKQFNVLLQYVLVTYIACYFSSLVTSISFFDFSTPIDARLLAPLYPAIFILLLFITWKYLSNNPSIIKNLVGFQIALIFLSHQVIQIMPEISMLHNYGAGYNNIRFDNNEIIHYVGTLPEETPIYSNWPDAIYAKLNRPARYLPQKIDFTNQTQEPDYGEKMEALKAEMNNGGMIAWIKYENWRYFLSDINDINELMCLQVSFHSEDGDIYQKCP